MAKIQDPAIWHMDKNDLRIYEVISLLGDEVLLFNYSNSQTRLELPFALRGVAVHFGTRGALNLCHGSSWHGEGCQEFGIIQKMVHIGTPNSSNCLVFPNSLSRIFFC